jgi:hypothetical protein
MDKLARLEAATIRPEIRAAVGTLLQSLEGHIAEEERQDGLFDWLLALLPGAKERVDGLWDDHERLVTDMRLLAELAGDEARGDFSSALSEFAKHLRRHERLENALVTEALAAGEAETV